MARNFLSGLFGKKKKPETQESSKGQTTGQESPEQENPSNESLPQETTDPLTTDLESLEKPETDLNPTSDESIVSQLKSPVTPDTNIPNFVAQPETSSLSESAPRYPPVQEMQPATLPSGTVEDPAITKAPDEIITNPKPTDLAPIEQSDQYTQEPKKTGFFSRLKSGLSKTSTRLTDGVTSIFTKKKLDDEMLEELENLLISADLGVDAAVRFTTNLAKSKFDKEVTDEEVRLALADEITTTLNPLEKPISINQQNRPHVILMTGVNGAGKTTTIGKLASKFKKEGLSVMLAAGDTFRAAAIEQLTVWGERTNTPVISRDVGADAAGLAFDALKEAQAQNIDVLMIDTAGRLQNRTELMDELAKIVRVIRKLDENAPHDTVLVLDATVGQNALSQLEAFQKIAGVSGMIMTKLDGTARGGVLVALADKFAMPVHYIGVGESTEDLQPFKASHFAKALTGIE